MVLTVGIKNRSCPLSPHLASLARGGPRYLVGAGEKVGKKNRAFPSELGALGLRWWRSLTTFDSLSSVCRDQTWGPSM
jgi:hypothetical protein